MGLIKNLYLKKEKRVKKGTGKWVQWPNCIGIRMVFKKNNWYQCNRKVFVGIKIWVHVPLTFIANLLKGFNYGLNFTGMVCTLINKRTA